MPRLPTADDLGTRIARPTRGVVSIAPDPMGGAIAGVANHIGQIAEEETRKLEELAAQDALNTLERKRLEMTYDPEKGFSNVTGSAVLNRPLLKEVPEAFDTEINNLAASLKTPRAQAYFKQRAANVKNGMTGDLFRHVALQTDKAYEAVETNTIKTLADAVAKDPTRLDGSLAGAGEVAASNAKRHTITDPAMLAILKQQTEGKIVVSALKSLMAAEKVDFNTVNDILKKHESIIPGDEFVLIKSKVAVAEEDHVADSAAETVWGEIGPVKPNDAVRIFDMEKVLRERLKDKPEALKKGIAGLRDRAAAFNAQQGENEAAGINSVFDLLGAGKSMSYIRRSEAWDNLSGKARDSFEQALESRAYTRAARQSAEANRDLATLQRNEKLALIRNADQYLADSDPTALSKMSRAMVASKRLQYGFDATQHLLAKWDALQTPGKLNEARIDEDDFNIAADKAGLNPFETRKTEDQKRALVNLKVAVEQRIAIEQRNGNLTRERKQAIVKEMVDNKVMLDVWGRNPSKPISMVSQDEAGSAYVVVGGREVKLSAIPLADRDKIIQTRQKRGLPITEQAIAETWVKANQSKTKSPH